MQRRNLILSAALSAMLALGASTAMAAGTDVPAPGQSAKIDAIKQRGTLKAAAIGEFPWLPENTSGSGDQFSGPAWVLANEYANRLGVKLEIVPVSHETKVPILATGEADISIAPLSVSVGVAPFPMFCPQSWRMSCIDCPGRKKGTLGASDVEDAERG